MCTVSRRKRRAILLLEVLLTLTLTLTALGLLTWSLTQYTEQSDIVLARQRALMAAESVLNELRGGREPDAGAFALRFPDMSVRVERSAGVGLWQGLERVQVEVVARVGTSAVPASLSGYRPRRRA